MSQSTMSQSTMSSSATGAGTMGKTIHEAHDTATTGNGKAAPRPGMRVDDRQAAASYANFCRVTGTPEELILDFGLNAQPFGTHAEPLPINQRIVMNFFTAKRMLHALQVTLERHESAFGMLETDVQKRVVPGARPKNESI